MALHHSPTLAPPQSPFRFQAEIQAMMSIAGDVRQPSAATSQLMESIVRAELIRLGSPCCQRDRLREAAARTESTKPVGLEDVFFQLRHDEALVRRISRALAWKEVRKSVKAGNENGPGADDGDPVEDLDAVGATARVGVANLPELKRVRLAADPVRSLVDDLPSAGAALDALEELAIPAAKKREEHLRVQHEDALTRAMPKDDYLEWSEKKQMGFLSHKGKRFREWVFGPEQADFKVTDDVVEVFSFLGRELVGRLTRGALLIKNDTDDGRRQRRRMAAEPPPVGLFKAPEERAPLQPEHLREYYRRTQSVDRPLQLFTGIRPMPPAPLLS